MTWLDRLKERVKETNIRRVAEELGFSRTTISLVTRGKYGASTDKVAARVRTYYIGIKCPHTGKRVTPADCLAARNRSVPTNNPLAIQHWRACQSCREWDDLTALPADDRTPEFPDALAPCAMPG